MTCEKDEKDIRGCNQRFEEGGRSRGLLFDVRIAEVLYRSSEFTRQILHPQRHQRGMKVAEKKKGERGEDGHSDTASVVWSNTDREERRYAREKEGPRKKQGLVGRLRRMAGDSSLATCRGFFPYGKNSLTVRYLSEVLRGTFSCIDYQP